MGRILLLTRYAESGASSRYRCYQYLPYLRSQGWEFHIVPLLDNEYVEKLYSGRRLPFGKILKSYLNRFNLCLSRNKYDFLWIQQEIFPWVPYFFESAIMKSSKPYIVDFDDPFFHRYDLHSSSLVRYLLKQKIDKVMNRASLVIAGNKYIADRAYSAGAKWIEIIPTVVDLNLYSNITYTPKNEYFTIGWIGSPSTAQYIKDIHQPLLTFCQNKRVNVVVIGTEDIKMSGIPITYKKWIQSTEVQEIQNFNVGIMPLKDTPWERGKCGLKLIQYMACARPTIGSPIGVNQEIITNGVDGFHATSSEDWIQSLNTLISNNRLCQEMGKNGRIKIENKYCIQKTSPILAQLFNEFFERKSVIPK